MLPEDQTETTLRLDASTGPVAADQALVCLAALAWAPILGTLPGPDQRRLARAATPRLARKSDVLFAVGDESRSVFLVRSGVIKIAADSDGHSLPVALLGPGDLVGTSALVGDYTSAYTATVIEDAELVSLPRVVLRRVLADHPEAARQLRAVFERRRNLVAVVTANQGRLTRPGNGRVISVHSPRGGAGTTTVAVTLARILARDHPRSVLLVDLSLPYNQCAFLTSMAPTTSLARVQQAPAEHRDDILLSGICAHESGFGLLAGVLRFEESDLITAELVARAIQTLRREFAYVVIDVGTHEPALARAALERSDHVLMVVPPDLAALKDTVSLRQSLGWLAPRLRLVVNHPAAKQALDGDAMRRMLAVETITEIPHDRPVADAFARGALPSLSGTSSAVARAAAGLAREMAPASAQPTRERQAREPRQRSRWIVG
jgi:pilus assembly protein CpaE